ncbi:hypothetical protein CROQUDRAFT_92508 [Cronartium quercuum f. sp. fusiforme G11]|uniref:Uncharacterized protein n=1 Tax=Cronartium quercuum f. sp. fusiforme G11 TaxID=708437 RepID=A0A9P6TBR4_9BASI|nr:hypothetical protein CROQUDRAFT_92508 [Cronartium quercuum f. sp. fusiforme G11]
MWKHLTPEEKEEYQKYVGIPREQLEDVNNEDILTEGNPMSQPANTIPTRPNTNHHLLSLEPIDSEPNTAHHPIKVCANPKSLEGAAKKFSKWLKKTELEVTQIARSTQSHILVIGVSTKLNANSFQMIAGSPLALQFMKMHQQTYVEFNFPAKFQLFCTGVEVHNLKPAMKLAISN